MEINRPITSVATDRNVARITLRGVEDRPGIAASVMEPLADAGISVDVIVQNASADGATDLSFTVPSANLASARQLVKERSNVQSREVLAQDGFAKISIIGTGMLNAPGYASRMFKALADAGVNIEMITTSEIRITCIVLQEQLQTAAIALHDAFELAKIGDPSANQTANVA